MNRTLHLFASLLGLALLSGCTIAEPAYRPDLGGYAMIHEKHEKKERTVVTNHSVRNAAVSHS